MTATRKALVMLLLYSYGYVVGRIHATVWWLMLIGVAVGFVATTLMTPRSKP